jgi:hypothetical protein
VVVPSVVRCILSINRLSRRQLSVQSKTLNLRAHWHPRYARSLTNGENLYNANIRSFSALSYGNGSC